MNRGMISPAAVGHGFFALLERPPVCRLDELDRRVGEQRAERPVDHSLVPVLHVRVGPHDDVARRLVDRLPERLTLARERAVARQDVRIGRPLEATVAQVESFGDYK